MLSETFWVFVVATASALCGIILKLSYDSKCSDVQCCCLKFKRDTKSEVEAEEFKIEHGIRPKDIELPKFKKEEDIEFGS